MSHSDPSRLPERSSMRVSDEERHQVAEVLRRAAGEGRLDLEELEERLESAFAAKTYGELVPLVRDLPTGGADVDLTGSARPEVAHHGDLATPSASVAIMGAVERHGAWELGERHTALAMMGGVEIDLRQAALPREATITAVAVMGGITITVDQYTRVDADGLGIMGSFGEVRPRVAPVTGPGSPLVRVRGVALMGAVEVVRKPREGKGRRLSRQELRELGD